MAGCFSKENTWDTFIKIDKYDSNSYVFMEKKDLTTLLEIIDASESKIIIFPFVFHNMTLSEKLDELFLDTVLELTELSSFKTSTEAGYDLMEKKYNERYQALLDNLSNSGKRTFL